MVVVKSITSEVPFGFSGTVVIPKVKNGIKDKSDHIQFYNGTTRVGEIGVQDTTWLRINQVTNKNICNCLAPL